MRAQRIAEAIYNGRWNAHKRRPRGPWDRERERGIARSGADSFECRLGASLDRQGDIDLAIEKPR